MAARDFLTVLIRKMTNNDVKNDQKYKIRRFRDSCFIIIK